MYASATLKFILSPFCGGLLGFFWGGGVWFFYLGFGFFCVCLVVWEGFFVFCGFFGFFYGLFLFLLQIRFLVHRRSGVLIGRSSRP